MTNTNPEAIRAIVTDVHAAVRRINGVQAGTPLANVQDAFQDHIGPDWRRDLPQTLPAMAHTYQCVEMGWWLLHEFAPGTPCNPPALPDDENTGPALPVRGDVVVVDGDTQMRIVSRRDAGAEPRWLAAPLDGSPAREITLQEITGYQDETPEPDDAVARILNAAINWEIAIRANNATGAMTSNAQRLTAEDILRCEVSAYLPLVTK